MTKKIGYFTLMCLMAFFVHSELLAKESNQAIEEIDSNEDGIVDIWHHYQDTIRRKSLKDSDFDQKVDLWVHYDKSGVLLRHEIDTNKDGLADRWKLFIKGSQEILRERDVNFDGKVDMRRLTKFTHDRMINAPRHLTFWKEEDKDFDGVIDYYRVRGMREPNPDKVGEKISVYPTKKRPGEKEEKLKGILTGRHLVKSKADWFRVVEKKEYHDE